MAWRSQTLRNNVCWATERHSASPGNLIGETACLCMVSCTFCTAPSKGRLTSRNKTYRVTTVTQLNDFAIDYSGYSCPFFIPLKGVSYPYPFLKDCRSMCTYHHRCLNISPLRRCAYCRADCSTTFGLFVDLLEEGLMDRDFWNRQKLGF